MQPEPIEYSTQLSNTSHVAESSTTAQYGISPNHLPTAEADSDLSSEERSESARSANEQGVDVARVQEQLLRLSVEDGKRNRPKASFQRISEYENALAPSPPKKLDEGPGFKIVKKKGSKGDDLKIEAFPNGIAPDLAYIALITNFCA